MSCHSFRFDEGRDIEGIQERKKLEEEILAKIPQVEYFERTNEVHLW